MGRRWRWLIRLVSLAVAALAALSLVAAFLALEQAGLVASYDPAPSPQVFAAANAVWGALFLVGAVGLWSIRRWGRRWTLAVVPLYAVFWLAFQALWGQSDFARSSLPFAVVRYGALVAAVWLVLNLPGVRRRFHLEM